MEQLHSHWTDFYEILYLSVFRKYIQKIHQYLTRVTDDYFTCKPIDIYDNICLSPDRRCGLVVRVSGYRYRGLGFDSRRYQILCVIVGLERGPLSLVRSIEELLE